jgi:hypothetical protein
MLMAYKKNHRAADQRGDDKYQIFFSCHLDSVPH